MVKNDFIVFFEIFLYLLVLFIWLFILNIFFILEVLINGEVIFFFIVRIIFFEVCILIVVDLS